MEGYWCLNMGKKLSKEDIIKRIEDIAEGRFTVVGEVKGTKDKVEFHCNVCGNNWVTAPRYIFKGQGCHYCAQQSRNNSMRTPNKELLKKIEDATSGNVSILDIPRNIHTKTPAVCNVCGYKWEVTPHHLLQGHGCPLCAKERTSEKERLSHEEILSRVKKATNDTIDILETTKGASHKAKARCKVCGYTWNAVIGNIANGKTGCPKCHKVRRRTREEAEQELYEKFNGKIEMVGEYKTAKAKTTFRCNECGYVFEHNLGNLLRQHDCPNCSGNRNYTHEEAVEKLNKSHNGNIVMMEKYVRNTDRMLFHCNVCGNEWRTTPSDTLRGKHGCPKCAGKQEYTEDEIIKKIHDASNGDIEVIGNPKGVRNYVEVHCKKCGHTWEALPTHLFRGVGCPICSPTSKGEDTAYEWLKEHFNGDFISYKKFDDLTGTGGGLLSYDFYIPSKNMCIEMQGRQHYEPVSRFGGEPQFQTQQEHDRRKRQYCIDNGITLLEIPYTDYDNIEKILEKELNS